MITLKNKKVLLLGLGLHGGGVATARWLHRQGAKLVVSDLKDERVLAPSLKALAKMRGVRYALGAHEKKDVAWADMVVYNPGVPKESALLKYARKLAKPIYNEATLFFDRCRAPVVAVTGTRGKSTTASLVAAMLKKKHAGTVLAGNIKSAFMLDVVNRAVPGTPVVLELSSWQLEGFAAAAAAPHVAVVTNVYPDHLNRYRTLADYYASKKEIFKYQREEHFLILNHADAELRTWQNEARSRILLFSRKDHADAGAFVRRGAVFFRSQNGSVERVMAVRECKLAGEHNVENALAAITAAKLMGVANASITAVLKHPPQLSGRQEIVGARGGVVFVNDTTATTPIAGIAALKRFSASSRGRKRIILIAGGADKKLDYAEWGRQVKRYCRSVYLLEGDASIKQKSALSGMRNASPGHNDLGVAVRTAFREARRGDVVLFSPAAASFNLWNHEFERGDNFIQAVESIS